MIVCSLDHTPHVVAGSSQTRETIGPIAITIPPGWSRSDVQGGNVSLSPPNQHVQDEYYIMIMPPSPAQGSNMNQHHFLWTAMTMTYGKPQRYSTNRSLPYTLDSAAHHFHGSEMLGVDPIEQGPQWVQLWSDRIDNSFIAILCFAKSEELLKQHHAELQAILSSVTRAAVPKPLPNLSQAGRGDQSNSNQSGNAKEGSLEEADALVAKTQQLNQEGRYREAIPLAKRAIQIREKRHGPEDPNTAVAINNLAELYRATGAYAEAELLYQKAVAIFIAKFGPHDVRTTIPLGNLGMFYQMTGAMKKAEPLLERVVAIREKNLGAEDALTGEARNNLANFYEVTGAYSRAEFLYQQALAIQQKVRGIEHPTTATILDNLAGLHTTMGSYDKALPLHKQALAIREKALGAEHADVATSLTNLGRFFHETGDYTQAETLFQRALGISEKALGLDHPDTTISRNNLAALYQDTGAHKRAEELYRRVLVIREKTLGSEHPSTANAQTNLATLLLATGSYKEAEPLLRRALAIREQSLGPAHPDTASAHGNLANAYHEAEDYAKAETHYQTALERIEKAMGKEHHRTANARNNLASLYLDQGAYAKAVAVLEQAIATNTQALGPHHPSTALFLGNLAIAQWAAGDAAAALASLERTQAIEQRNAKIFLLSGSDARKRAYMQQLQPSSYVNASLSPDFVRSRAVALGLTSVLQTKGLVLDAMTDSVSRLRQRLKPEDRAVLQQLTGVAQQLSAVTYQSNASSASDIVRQRMAELSAQLESLEAEVSKRSAELRPQLASVTLQAIQRAIPPKTALIEWIQYRPQDPRVRTKKAKAAKQRYAAYIMKREGEPVAVDLGEVQVIDDLAKNFRRSLSERTNLFVREDAKDVYEKVFKPLRPFLGDAIHLLIAPDGALNIIPFAALIDEANNYLASRYETSYLTSGRDLLSFGSTSIARGGPVIVANPDYGPSSPTDAKPSSATQLQSFPPLAETAEEGSVLKILLKVDTEFLLTQGKATEARLKALHGPRVLHIATHGFFLPDESPSAAAKSAGGNPLLRSGLVLAGANVRRSGEKDDGILTAAEVAQMDLRGTQLVVLSACETGLGDVQNGEGVYGLRRALVLAGAETQVTSLWKVADEATKDLMVDYYQRLLKGEGRSEGLRNAQPLCANMSGTRCLSSIRVAGGGRRTHHVC
jgi:CHAT domain-containing protein/tetratricopeptide (TPR) repeat protein